MKKKTIVHFYFFLTLILGFAQLSLADLNDGLVAYYPFIGNAADETGNGNDCLVLGATLTAGYNGNNAAAYHFDGINDYLDCLATSSLDISSALTVSAWINPAGVPDDWKVVVARWSGFQDQELFGLYINSILEVGGEISTRGGGLLRVSDQNVIVPFEWQHVAMVYDTNSHIFRLFRNGVLLYEWGGLFFGGTPEMPLVDTDLTIGVVKRNGLFHYSHGSIDDVRIYNRALSDFEIA
jgi:Concanavalin A-like lectin/glucanases superfamily